MDLCETKSRACRWANIRWTRSILFSTLIYLILIITRSYQDKQPPSRHHGHHHHMSHGTPPADAKPNPYHHVKILIPNLPPHHYPYWLKNHPVAAKVFGEICDNAQTRPHDLDDLAKFQNLHLNLSFEDPQYTQVLDYGKRVLRSICSKIKDVSKSCWGYENNCQDIYLMPECTQSDPKRPTKDDQDKKIAWFSQTDFGYILEQARGLSKYCSPDKTANLNEVSTFECTKHFTSCRGQNLYVHFNTSALSSQRLSAKLTKSPPVLNVVGGWRCDLQLKRIQEEAGRDGWLESWHGELKEYNRVDELKPTESCDITEEKQVFFVKLDSTNNLYDYLTSFINLYATIHLNNRFSEDNRVIVWNSHLPRSKTFEQMWYAFSKLPPVSIGQLDGKKVCFKKFVFAIPPRMRDGLNTDKHLVEGCSKSGLYHAFRSHIVHRLRIPNVYDLNFHRKTKGRLLRIVILSRALETEFRNILNEKELEETIKNSSTNFYVRVLRYNSMDFGHVLLETLNSDIVIGLHGTGLAYSIFLPDWASLIELHDCGKDRYHNLARLRGVSYFSSKDLDGEPKLVKKVRVSEQAAQWSRLNQSRLLNHDEYSNYEVNIGRFIELFTLAKSQVYKAREDYFQQQEALELKPDLTIPTQVPISTGVTREPVPSVAPTMNHQKAQVGTEPTGSEHDEL